MARGWAGSGAKPRPLPPQEVPPPQISSVTQEVPPQRLWAQTGSPASSPAFAQEVLGITSSPHRKSRLLWASNRKSRLLQAGGAPPLPAPAGSPASPSPSTAGSPLRRVMSLPVLREAAAILQHRCGDRAPLPPAGKEGAWPRKPRPPARGRGLPTANRGAGSTKPRPLPPQGVGGAHLKAGEAPPPRLKHRPRGLSHAHIRGSPAPRLAHAPLARPRPPLARPRPQSRPHPLHHHPQDRPHPDTRPRPQGRPHPLDKPHLPRRPRPRQATPLPAKPRPRSIWE